MAVALAADAKNDDLKNALMEYASSKIDEDEEYQVLQN